MGKITPELLRKRAEHNERELSTLEEISLHQENIERIEGIDLHCRHLKILYLQNNLIPKIENVSRLKELEYINLALNNITEIENLEKCEMLNKIDLTINFIGNVLSVETLSGLEHLRELFLTGNPCAMYEGYRDYVIAAVPQLEQLDGKGIKKSERILAIQEISTNRERMVAQYKEYMKKEEMRKKEKADKQEDPDTPFWDQQSDHSPEARLEAHRYAEEEKEKENPKPKKEPKKRNFFRDGRPLNMNEASIDFTLTGHGMEEPNYVLELAYYKYLDTSQIELDVQPTYVRATCKEKVFQLALPEEINPDAGSAKRSQISGHLVITLPKVKQVVKALKKKKTPKPASPEPRRELLEVTDKVDKIDIANIVAQNKEALKNGNALLRRKEQRANDADFVDDDDVPPLL